MNPPKPSVAPAIICRAPWNAPTVSHPILTLLPNGIPAFPDTLSMADVGLDFKPLLRFRSYLAKPDVPTTLIDNTVAAYRKIQERFGLSR